MKILVILSEDQQKYWIISRITVFRIRNVSDKHCRENQNTHFVLSNIFRKSCRLWDNVERYSGAGQATDENTVPVNWMLDT